jgi:hypothetical protein
MNLVVDLCKQIFFGIEYNLLKTSPFLFLNISLLPMQSLKHWSSYRRVWRSPDEPKLELK